MENDRVICVGVEACRVKKVQLLKLEIALYTC
jgi:hypothetical protein